jgi:hypothetical protein
MLLRHVLEGAVHEGAVGEHDIEARHRESSSARSRSRCRFDTPAGNDPPSRAHRERVTRASTVAARRRYTAPPTDLLYEYAIRPRRTARAPRPACRPRVGQPIGPNVPLAVRRIDVGPVSARACSRAFGFRRQVHAEQPGCKLERNQTAPVVPTRYVTAYATAMLLSSPGRRGPAADRSRVIASPGRSDDGGTR